MLVSLLKYRKPSFAYLYTIFGVFLVILVILSVISYQRLTELVRKTDEADKAYIVLLNLVKLGGLVKDLETTGKGFMLTRDSSFLSQMEEFNSEITPTVDSLGKLLQGEDSLTTRLNNLNTLIGRRIQLLRSNIQKVASDDTVGLRASINEGEYYMSRVRTELAVLQTQGVEKSSRLDKSKRFYETITPGFFGIVFIFSCIVSLLAFFYIIREIRIRLKYQKELERRLHELNRSYAELEQFTFIASHDLQEPLRKIRTFSDRLVSQYGSKLEPNARDIVERMDVSAGRLQELLHDIANFSALINNQEEPSLINLNEIVTSAFAEFKDIIVTRDIRVELDQLPELTGYRRQLLLLFSALVDNAIKFSKATEQPVVKIKYVFANKGTTGGDKILTQDYLKISVEDNGIGFNNEFADRIFMIFQRLHSQQSQYRGKGIGLAIVQRVMINHNGFIIAKGSPGSGSVFSLFFPARPIA